MRVFLDTNVLVSGFATQGLSAMLIRLVMAEHTLLTGEVVLLELRQVLREKFRLPETRLAEVESLLRQYHVEPIPHQRPTLDVRDPDDTWVLASAIQARADMLVTGDKDLLDVADLIQRPQIISPRGFWDKAKGTSSP